MLGPLLDVAAQFGGRDLFNLLRAAAVQEHDHTLRELLLEALGSFRDPRLAAASLDLLLSKDFDLRESFYPLLFGPLAYAETRDVPFTFVKQHLDSLLKRLPREVGEDYAATLPTVGSSFCDAKRRDELDSFFRDRVKDYTGRPTGPEADARGNRPLHLRTPGARARVGGLPQSVLIDSRQRDRTHRRTGAPRILSGAATNTNSKTRLRDKSSRFRASIMWMPLSTSRCTCTGMRKRPAPSRTQWYRSPRRRLGARSTSVRRPVRGPGPSPRVHSDYR